jgi:hypothetical protein
MLKDIDPDLLEIVYINERPILKYFVNDPMYSNNKLLTKHVIMPEFAQLVADTKQFHSDYEDLIKLIDERYVRIEEEEDKKEQKDYEEYQIALAKFNSETERKNLKIHELVWSPYNAPEDYVNLEPDLTPKTEYEILQDEMKPDFEIEDEIVGAKADQIPTLDSIASSEFGWFFTIYLFYPIFIVMRFYGVDPFAFSEFYYFIWLTSAFIIAWKTINVGKDWIEYGNIDHWLKYWGMLHFFSEEGRILRVQEFQKYITKMNEMNELYNTPKYNIFQQCFFKLCAWYYYLSTFELLRWIVWLVIGNKVVHFSFVMLFGDYLDNLDGWPSNWDLPCYRGGYLRAYWPDFTEQVIDEWLAKHPAVDQAEYVPHDIREWMKEQALRKLAADAEEHNGFRFGVVLGDEDPLLDQEEIEESI